MPHKRQQMEIGGVKTAMLRFSLAPTGRPLYEAQAPSVANPLDRFIKGARG